MLSKVQSAALNAAKVFVSRQFECADVYQWERIVVAIDNSAFAALIGSERRSMNVEGQAIVAGIESGATGKIKGVRNQLNLVPDTFS